jgi:hypothetical protein
MDPRDPEQQLPAALQPFRVPPSVGCKQKPKGYQNETNQDFATDLARTQLPVA